MIFKLANISKIASPLKKITMTMVFLSLFAYGIYWLWQRQPQNQEILSQTATAPDQKAKSEESFQTTPADGSVINNSNIQFQGRTDPHSYVVIYAENFQNIAKARENGYFEKEVALVDGLNLVEIVSISPELKENKRDTLTIFVTKNTSLGKTVLAGTVKTVFDTLITITTSHGDKNIRTAKSTDIEVPKENEEDQATTSTPLKNIRVGDFAIALGNVRDNDSLVATKVQIMRENKNQVNKQLIVGKVLTTLRDNLFSVKSLQNSQISQLTLGRKSQIAAEKQSVKESDITKEKMIIIIFHQEDDKKIADFVYVLPQ